MTRLTGDISLLQDLILNQSCRLRRNIRINDAAAGFYTALLNL